ncbi:MAG TPA: response regulator, partial [Byssovorax sp.]
MARGVVLVIEDDEWVARLLANAIRGADYEVVVCATAKSGVETAVTSQPDCIICDVDLPDNDGYWVARNVRTQSSRVSVTPFLFLSGLDDQESRLEGFHVGADVYMTKPFRVDEVVAQVGALVAMAARLRQRRESLISVQPTPNATAIEGDLGQMSIATVLTILEMERRSGAFEVVSKKRRASLDIAAGYIVSGVVGGTKVSALAAVRTMLGWNVGRFSFNPSSPRDPPLSQKSIGAFLIEATRLEDESARVELDLPPSRRRSEPKFQAPVLGGPPSTAEDFAPASSRAPRRPSDKPPTGQPTPRAGTPAIVSESAVTPLIGSPPGGVHHAPWIPPPPPALTALKPPPAPAPRTAAIPPPRPPSGQMVDVRP